MFRSTADEGSTAVSPGASSAPSSMDGVTQDTNDTRNEAAVIGQGLRVAGNLECEGDIVIAGLVEGEVTGRVLMVTEDGNVKGKIRCEVVQVMGDVEGQISAASVEIAKTGLVIGEISYDVLVVEDGATIDGQLRRRQHSTG